MPKQPCSHRQEAATLFEVLAFQRLGAGAKTLILIHGFLGSGRNLMSLARRLLQIHPNTQLLLPDLRGHGQSPPLLASSDLTTLGADILELADVEVASGDAHLIGHSLGGRVALACLALAPQRWASLTLLDIGPSPVGELGGGLQAVFERLVAAPETLPSRAAMRAYFLQAGIAPGLADWIVMNGQLVDGQFVWKIDRLALQSLHHRASAQDLWPILQDRAKAMAQTPQNTAHVTCIRGGASSYVSDACMARMTRLGVRTGTLANAGHFVHVDAMDALLEWLF